jgi:NitT/TauT family transport system permease protein
VIVRRLGDALIVFGCLLAAWQGLYWLVGDTALTSPVETIARLGALMNAGSFWGHVAETGYAFALAVLISLLGGIGAGTLLGLNRTSAIVSEPILIALYSLPKVTLYPLVLLCFGLGISAKIAFGAMHGLIPVAIFTMKAITQIKPVYWRTAHALRLSPRQVALTLALPAVLPEVMSGARLGFSLSLLGVLIGEMFASKRGLGFLITTAMGLGDTATLIAIALLISAFAIATNWALLVLQRHFSPRQ